MKAKIGDEFIVEIGDIIYGSETHSPQYVVKGFDKVMFDDTGISKLKKYHELSDEITAHDGWYLIRNMMNLPIKERAEIFNVSKNQACFKDISEKYTFEEALSLYIDHMVEKAEKQAKKNIIGSELDSICEDNDISLNTLLKIIEDKINED